MVVSEELPVIVFAGPTLERDPHQGGEMAPILEKVSLYMIYLS